MDITTILSKIDQGDPSAAEQLLPLVYDELRSLAAARMARENPGQTLQATALVHEVTACGRAGRAYEKLLEFHDAGVELPLISTHGDKEQTLLALADAAGKG